MSLEIIRDFLGRLDVKTTQIYARASLEMKRRALEKVVNDIPLPGLPSWQQNKTLLDWLHSLCGREDLAAERQAGTARRLC